MTAATIDARRRVARTGTVRRLATPGQAATAVGIARVVLDIVVVVLALAGLATAGAIVAGPLPEAGPQPGF